MERAPREDYCLLYEREGKMRWGLGAMRGSLSHFYTASDWVIHPVQVTCIPLSSPTHLAESTGGALERLSSRPQGPGDSSWCLGYTLNKIYWEELGDCDWHINARLCIKQIMNENRLYNRELYSVLCGGLNGNEIQKQRGYMYTYGWFTLSTVENNTIL